MAGIIITGGSKDSYGYTTRAYLESTGELLWSVKHGSDVYCVCVDDAGNVYCGGDYTIKKYNINGELQWSISAGDTAYCIAADSEGYIYSGTKAGTTFWLNKYDGDGNAVLGNWPISMFNSVRGICVDSNNDVYVTGRVANAGSYTYTTKKYNSSGVEQWWNNFGAGLSLNSINITGDYVSTGGGSSYGGNTGQKLDRLTGSVVSEFSDGAPIYGIARNENADRAGIANSSSITTHIGGATANHGNIVYCIAINSTTGQKITTRKYTSAGVEVTDDHWPIYNIGTVRSIAWTPFNLFYKINAPSLSIPMIIGVPAVSSIITIPSLSFPLFLSTPDFSGILQPPDLYAVNYPVKIIYRLYVSGETLVKLPISSFQCNRSLGQSTFLTVVIPRYSNELVNLLESRKNSNNNLMIYSGYIDRNGDEIMGEFIKSTLIDIRVEQDFSRGHVNLYGRVIPTRFTAQSRALQKISKRGKTIDGKRTATCSVDFNLRPNDTAIDGFIHWTVGSITLFVDSSGSRMDVMEN